MLHHARFHDTDHPHPDARRFARGGHRGGPGPGHHERHGPGGGHRDGGRARLGRFFEHGDLRLVILALIAEKPRHGYEIIKAIEERVGGAYSPSPGVVYPTLTLLEELGHVTVTAGEGSKKLHALTPEGEQLLAANRSAVDALLARIEEAGRANAGTDAPPVRRAMENLKLALRMRLGQTPITAEQVHAIAAALDAAAAAVERV